MTDPDHGETRVLSASEHGELIRALSEAVAEMDRLAADYNAAGPDGAAALEGQLDAASRRARELYQVYEDRLPRPAISRCPFTGAVVRMAIDTLGLNGPWWNHEIPARPVEVLPDTVFAVAGAVNLGRSPPKTPFLCKPGPGAPYVVPRLLVHPEIKAVVSTLKVSEYDAYAIIYYAEDPPADIVRINTWGLDHYVAETSHGEGYLLRVPDCDEDFDFDLEFYIRTGRLMWIVPDDETLTLNSVAGSCPYIGMKGRRYPVAILDGEMWNCLIDEDADQAAATPA